LPQDSVARKVPLLCDNESAIRMADNPVEHSRTKHIDIWHHFLRDHLWGKDIPRVHRKDKRPHKRPVGLIIRKLIPSWAWGGTSSEVN
jgi:hypothetical protein